MSVIPVESALFDSSPIAEGRWSALGPERFANDNGSLFGGYVVGSMLSTLMREPSCQGTPIAMTTTFLAPAAPGPMTIATRCLRAARTLAFWQAEVAQGDDEKLCAHSVVTFAERPETARFGWLEMPKAPPPESFPRATQGPRMVASFDRRLVQGTPPSVGDSTSIAWVSEDDGQPVDHARLAMFADLFPPRVYYGVSGLRPSTTVSQSLYFHATRDEIDAVGADFVLQHATGRSGSAGICDLTGSLWRRDGVLLATTEQLCWFR
jgi:acyl-coenzyme A thioesterase PaaI-like protein